MGAPMKRRNVFIDGEQLPDDGEEFVDIPKSNDRMWSLELRNLRRGADRVGHGTLTMWRMRALFEAIAKRYPDAVKTPPSKKPLIVRTRRAGPIIAIIKPLDGPVASVAQKH